MLFKRDADTVEIENATWLAIIRFLVKYGWKPSVPDYFFLATNYTVSEADAKSFAEAGKIVLDETMRDPLAAHSVIRFDMGKFAEVIEFAADGGFAITEG
jgi:hypothetical protein